MVTYVLNVFIKTGTKRRAEMEQREMEGGVRSFSIDTLQWLHDKVSPESTPSLHRVYTYRILDPSSCYTILQVVYTRIDPY